MDNVIDFVNVNRDRYLDELKALLAIPSISALPEHAPDIRRCAEWCADEMRRIGLQNVKLIETAGNPVVYGDWLNAPDAPTILFYGHYDVQPVDPVELWQSPPFEATIRDGEIYARGAADDKGQVFMHFKAVEAHMKQNGRLPVNMKFIIEGEEEVGSAHLDEFVRSHRSELAADVVVISDSGMFAKGVPSICYGLRGLVYFQIDLRGSSTDLHSGSFGGALANPGMVLAQMLAQMKDRGGRVKIPGFYDDVVRPTPGELRDLARSGFTVAGFKRDHLLRSLRTDDPIEVMKRIWLAPTFEVHGIAGGYQGPGVKTVVPPRATAIVSCRLVPDMDPKKIVRLVKAFVKKKNRDVVVYAEHELPAYQGKTTGPYADAIRGAMKFAFGKEPVFVREGGSIGAVLSMERVLKSPVYFLGLSLPEHGYHAPNENFDWPQAEGGMAAFADYFRRLGEMRKA